MSFSHTPMSSMHHARHIATTIQEFIAACDESMAHQAEHLSGAGATFLLEKKLAEYTEKKFAIAFPNATTALTTLCLAMDIRRSEVITTPITWGGAVASIFMNGNNLRFSLVEPTSLHLDPDHLNQTITSKTRAVLSTDLNGSPADSSSIKNFCTEHGLKYISDSAQSLGSFRDGKPAGWFADAVVLSFSPGKSVFGGEGGAVVTDDSDLYERLVWFSQHPDRQKSVFGLSNYNEYAPINGRINPLSSILLHMNFQSSVDRLRKHQELCHKVLARLVECGFVESDCRITAVDRSTYFNFSVQLQESTCVAEVNTFFRKECIPFQSKPHNIKLIPLDPQFRKQFKGKYSCSSQLRKQSISDMLKNRVYLEYLPKG